MLSPVLCQAASVSSHYRNIMRIVVIFLLSFCLSTASGQVKIDTLNFLEAKARAYLSQMYSRGNFDSAYKNWHDFIFPEAQEIYKKKGIILPDKIATLNKVRDDYNIFYTTNKNFELIKFIDENISDESKVPTVRFQYSYKEQINDQDFTNSSYLYFIFDIKSSIWQIWDFRIAPILGDPKRWLK